MKRKSPCYDAKTKTDCPNRCVDCKQTCKKWKEFEEFKKQDYIDRRTDFKNYVQENRQRWLAHIKKDHVL
jgi:hypothetical protein